MEKYIRLEEYPRQMKIQKGDIIFVSSDAKIMLWDAKANTGEFDLLLFIDSLKEAVGENGTIIFPTYNWDFCQGKTFNYRTTPCRTGTLGALALKRGGFKRTKHPIYSFAVWGKYQNDLCSLENKDSFGVDSPFAFFKKNNVKNYIIDVSLKNSLTYVHFVEQQSGLVNYRYLKNFQGNYIDESGKESTRSYSMFVRNLDMDVQIVIDPIEENFIAEGVEEQIQINNSNIKLIYLGLAYDIILRDIKENRARKLSTYLGQED